MSYHTDILFVEFEEKDLSGYTLIEGFPGMGLVGTIGAKFLVERLKFREFGYIDSDIFVPIIRIKGGYPIYPSRIYIKEENKLVVLVSEQIIPKQYTNKVAKAVVDWVQQKKISRVISLSGIHAEMPIPGMQKIYGIATNAKSKKILEEHNIEIIEDGVTTGVTAMILLAMKKTDLEAFSILGNVKIAADYEAAAELIKKLNEMAGLDIDIKPLMKEAKDTEQELLKHLGELRKTQDKVEQFEARTPMYT